MDLKYEENLFQKGYSSVGGVDEVGRGPLAGPVVSACVIVKIGFKIPDSLKDVKDSKKLSEKKREELFKILSEVFPGFGLGICNQDIIDKVNILQASFLAMKKAIEESKDEPGFVLVDGKFKIPKFHNRQENIIKGDSCVFSIAASSIVAKVIRDRLMKEIHEKYPEYGFDKHKGYGTKLHLEALEKYGPTPIHRKSFAPVKKFFL
jgi:ribonuclease HII